MNRKQPQDKPPNIQKPPPPPPPPPPPFKQKSIMLTDNRGFTVIFEVEVEKALPFIKQKTKTWRGIKRILEKHNSNYIKAYLSAVAGHIYWNLEDSDAGDLIDSFYGLEGWTTLDGSQGINLIHVSRPEQHSSFTYMEVPFLSGISILRGAQ